MENKELQDLILINKIYNLKLMKRGKRQIIEKVNLFQGEAEPLQSPYAQQSNNNSEAAFLSANQALGTQQVSTNTKETKTPVLLTGKEKVSQNGSANTVVKENGEQEKKKRLEMLRQKYLKNSKEEKVDLHSANAVKDKEQEYENSKQHKKYTHKSKLEQRELSLIQVQQKRSNEQVKQRQEQKQFNGNKKEIQQPISKPSSNFTKIVGVPRAGQGQKRGVPPPPPPSKPFSPLIPEVGKREGQFLQDSLVKQQTKKNTKIANAGNENSKQHNQIEGKININSEKQKEDKFGYNIYHSIQKWLTNFQNQKLGNLNNVESITSAFNQHPQFLRGVIQNFLLRNRSEYSQEQSAFILQSLRNQPISTLTKTLFLIKCGSPSTQDWSYLSEEPDHCLESLVAIKQIFLEVELNKFIVNFIKNLQYHEQDIPKLLQLNARCPSLIELVQNYKFSSVYNVLQSLRCLRRTITSNGGDQICTAYYRLISIVVNEVQEEGVLESILKQINEITYQTSYQLKKDLKLKIIEKMDKISNSGQTVNHQNSRRQKEAFIKVEDIKSKNEKEKGSGVTNLFGFVNQTFKKLTNQIVQKEPEPVPKEEVKWDPVSGRYLVNGKIPDDENTNSKIQLFEEDNEDKAKKKKVPPPPPKFGTKRQQNQLMKQKKPEEQVLANLEGNGDSHAYNQQDNQGNRNFPQRMGIKGISKKPKVQARYT